MEWIKQMLKKPVKIDLSNVSITERVNAPLHLRLRRYKDIKRETSEYTEWVHYNDDKLTSGWHSYSTEIKLIPFSEYCMRFYYGTLDKVSDTSKAHKSIHHKLRDQIVIH
jgi:hypothetical protein